MKFDLFVRTHRLTESPMKARRNRLRMATNRDRNHMFFCFRSKTSSRMTKSIRKAMFFALYSTRKMIRFVSRSSSHLGLSFGGQGECLKIFGEISRRSIRRVRVRVRAEDFARAFDHRVRDHRDTTPDLRHAFDDAHRRLFERIDQRVDLEAKNAMKRCDDESIEGEKRKRLVVLNKTQGVNKPSRRDASRNSFFLSKDRTVSSFTFRAKSLCSCVHCWFRRNFISKSRSWGLCSRTRGAVNDWNEDETLRWTTSSADVRPNNRSVLFAVSLERQD